MTMSRTMTCSPSIDVEAHARARVVERRLERVLDVDVVVPELLVPIDDPPARVLELHRAGRIAQRHLRRAPPRPSRSSRFTPVKATSQSRVRGPSFTGMIELRSPARTRRRGAGSGRQVSDGSSGCEGSGSPDGSYVHASGTARGRGKRDAAAGGRARIAARAHDTDRADLGVEEPLVLVELLNVLHGAVVGVGDERGVGVQLERSGAARPRPAAAARRSADRGRQAAGIGVDEQSAPGSSSSRKLSISVPIAAGRARAPGREVLDRVELEARIRRASTRTRGCSSTWKTSSLTGSRSPPRISARTSTSRKPRFS